MCDEREAAQRKKNGQPLPQAPKQQEPGRGSHKGHLVTVGGESTTVSDHALVNMPRARRTLLGRGN
ncbi:MAG TPA: hypothetical protein VLB73_04830 [Patescibacteria group bacterium]|nr:hypothetical protein [Patescibacteria group bacterium]